MRNMLDLLILIFGIFKIFTDIFKLTDKKSTIQSVIVLDAIALIVHDFIALFPRQTNNVKMIIAFRVI